MSKDTPSYDDRNGKREKMPPGAPPPDAPRLPTIQVSFNPVTQGVGIHFEPTEFKSWDFIVATLEMAKSFAEFNRNVTRAQAMQQQQQEAIATQQLRNSLKL